MPSGVQNYSVHCSMSRSPILTYGRLKHSFCGRGCNCESQSTEYHHHGLLSTSFMWPNTLYFVVMPEHSICQGGHFYGSSTIQDACYGVFHSFVSGMLVTNTEHTIASRQLLCRMLAFYERYLIPSPGTICPPPIDGSLIDSIP